MSDDNETLGYRRVVRDGDDCHWHKNTSNLFMFDGNIYRDQRNGYNPFGVTIGGMLPEYTTTVTPVRLEPCPTPGWRTDVENAPENEYIWCLELEYHKFPIMMKCVGSRWFCGTNIGEDMECYCEHEIPTHWMPIPTLPETANPCQT